MQLPQPRQPSIEERCDPSRLYPNGFHAPPARFASAGTDRRLTEELRGPLRRHRASPVHLLAEAAAAFQQRDLQLGNALADLCVTGRQMYQCFCASPPEPGQVLRAARRAVDDHHVRAMVERALERAYRVAWALQGLAPRCDLGWIAVSSEDDPPHRPVNVPAPSFPQHDLQVAVRPTAHARGHAVTTRFIVARPGTQPTSPVPPAEGIRTRRLPPEQPVRIAAHERLLLYVHGHAARLEDCLDLAAAVATHGFTMVAMDLPCCGYASMIEHTDLADVAPPGAAEAFPLLEHIEQFVIDFVLALEQRVGRAIQHQIAAVIGGGLGGHLALRLAQRDLVALPFLGTVVAWSTACVWTPSNDVPCHQPDTAGARAEREESQSPMSRRWHWRVGQEQLRHSQGAPARWDKIRARTLLVAGADAAAPRTHIHDATGDLGRLLLTTPGRRLLVENAGHALHRERPHWLARELRHFLPPRRPVDTVREAWTPWRRLGGILTTRPAVGIDDDGRLEVFARGVDHRVHHIGQAAPNGPWASGWATLQDDVASADLGRRLATASNGNGRREVIAYLADAGWSKQIRQSMPRRDRDASLRQLIGKAQDSASAIERVGAEPLAPGDGGPRFGSVYRWLLAAALVRGGWIHIPGMSAFGWWKDGPYVGCHAPQLVGMPVLAQRRDGRLGIFARDTRGLMYHIWETAPDTWHDTWVPIPGGAVTSDAVVALNVDGRLEVFACSKRRELVHAWQTSPDGGWTAWSSLGGNLDHASLPAVARNAWGELQVFARWQDGATCHRRLLPDHDWFWAPWQCLSGAARTDPVVAANADGRLSVFVVGADGALYVSEQNTAG
jgi:hypothetical protein